MFLIAYILLFTNIVFILRLLTGICSITNEIEDDNIMKDFIGKNTYQEEQEPETYEDFGHEE